DAAGHSASDATVIAIVPDDQPAYDEPSNPPVDPPPADEFDAGTVVSPPPDPVSNVLDGGSFDAGSGAPDAGSAGPTDAGASIPDAGSAPPADAGVPNPQ